MDALRPLGIPPGDYVMPFAGGADHLKSDAFRAKVEKAIEKGYGDLYSPAIYKLIEADE